ncbi:MAK10-like protein [Tanacetum coccineum]
MGGDNHIRTLGDYSKPSHEVYRNAIELPVGNNVVPLRSDTNRLVQNRCSFHGLRSEDPNQHLKDFLKLVDSLDFDGVNRERTQDLALYDNESWNDPRDFSKPFKAIALPQDVLSTYDHYLIELENQVQRLMEAHLALTQPTQVNKITTSCEIKLTAPLAANSAIRMPTNLRKSLRTSLSTTTRAGMTQKNSSLTHIPHAYADAMYSNPRPQSHNEPPKLNPFTFHKRTGPSPQPQALGTTFEDRAINDRMSEMFGLLKELTTSRTPEKVLIREEAKFSITKNVMSISLARGEEERSDKMDEPLDNTVKPTGTETEIPVKEAERNNDTKNKPKKAEKEEVGLVDNNRFNDSLSKAQVGKVKGKTYNVLPRGTVYVAILKKKITKKEDIGGNFEIPCSIRGLKHLNTVVDQGSDVNGMPYSTYMKLTDERPAETNIRLSLASHSYIYPLGITEDVLVEVAEHVYLVDFVILNIKEDEMRPFILGTPFLTTAKAVIKFDKGTITLRSGKSKISFHRIPESPDTMERGVKNDIEPIAPTITMNKLVLE